MSNVLEQLKARRRHEVVLRSGLKIGFHYPNIEEQITKVGRIAMPAIAKVAESVDPEKPPTEEEAIALAMKHPDEMEVGLTYVRLMVAEMLDDIDGEPVEAGDDREAIVQALEPEDRQTLFLIATRQLDPDTLGNGANPGEA